MIGCYDFCGHYEWTFEWFRREGGEALNHEYWEKCICEDSQRHADALIRSKGFDGMEEYWGHTLQEEGAAYVTSRTQDAVRIDMHDCPSKGFLLRNGLQQYADYCDHCMGWIGPMMDSAGFKVFHEHNHQGQCGWEFRRKEDNQPPSAPGEISGPADVRLRPDWDSPVHDVFHAVFSARTKEVKRKEEGHSCPPSDNRGLESPRSFHGRKKRQVVEFSSKIPISRNR